MHEREEIFRALVEDPAASWAGIGRRVGRHPTTIAREVARGGGRECYGAASAPADRQRRRPRAAAARQRQLGDGGTGRCSAATSTGGHGRCDHARRGFACRTVEGRSAVAADTADDSRSAAVRLPYGRAEQRLAPDTGDASRSAAGSPAGTVGPISGSPPAPPTHRARPRVRLPVRSARHPRELHRARPGRHADATR